MSELLIDIHSQLLYIPRAIVLTGIVVFAYLYIKGNDFKYIKAKMIEVIKQPWLLMFLIYFSFIIISTLIARWPKKPYRHIFSSFGLYNENGWNRECIENIFLFIPYTFTYLLGVKPRKPWRASIVLSACTTVSIELIQLLFWLGEFQIADIFHNFIGGLIGYLLWAIINVLLRVCT